MSLAPPYSFLHQLNLTHHKECNWYFLLSYYSSYPPPNEDYVRYKVAILNYIVPGLKSRISEVLAGERIAHGVFRLDTLTVIVTRSRAADEKSVTLALSKLVEKCGCPQNSLEIVSEEARQLYGAYGAWPLILPYAAAILPTLPRYFDMTHMSRNYSLDSIISLLTTPNHLLCIGALTAEQPNVTTLRVAAMSPLMKSSASMVTKAVTRVVSAFTAEKAGSMIDVFAGGSAGAAAGTMFGKDIDNVVSSSPSSTAPELVTNTGQASSVYQLVGKGRITWEQAKEEVKRLNAYDLATACVRQGKTVEDIENILRLL